MGRYWVPVGETRHSNSQEGIFLWNSSSNNTITGNNSYSSQYGIHLSNTSNNTVTGNNFYSNSYMGIGLDSSSNNNTLTGNNVASNTTYGISLQSSSNNNTLIGNNVYSNPNFGIYATSSSSNTIIGGNLGYSAAGVSLKNSSGEVYFNPGTPATPETFILKGVRVNSTGVGISTAGMDVDGASLISYNQDFDTGTVRIWGNYRLAGSTLTLDHTLQLYVSTNTAPKLMRGTGHSITSVVTYDAATLSELITVRHTGGDSWTVTGSSSGVIGAPFTCPGTCNFNSTKVSFTLVPGGTRNVDDMLDFVTMAASNDANMQKELLFGYSAAGYNNGQSKIEIDSTGGIQLKGKPDGTANVLIDMIAGNSTYYLFVDSGAFTATYSSFTNMGPGGIQVSGNKGFTLGNSNFDYFGFTTAGSTNAYITARTLTANTTVYNTAFGTARAGNPLWNVHVEGTDITSGLYFRGDSTALGARWGETYDDELGASNKVTWWDTACDARTSAGTGLWSAPGTWDIGSAPSYCSSVTIRAGDIVTINSPTAVSSGAWVNGWLKASRVTSSTWTLVKGDINVNSGGYLDYGSEADPLPTAVTAYLILSSGSFAGQYGLIVNNGGDFTVRGATKTPYAYATGSIAATGDTNLTVYGSTSIVGWQIGDVITIGPTQGNGVATTSTRTISSISGGPSYTIGWSNGDLGTARNLSSTSPIIVSNLTRNVVVRSSGTTVATANGNSAYIRNPELLT